MRKEIDLNGIRSLNFVEKSLYIFVSNHTRLPRSAMRSNMKDNLMLE